MEKGYEYNINNQTDTGGGQPKARYDKAILYGLLASIGMGILSAVFSILTGYVYMIADFVVASVVTVVVCNHIRSHTFGGALCGFVFGPLGSIVCQFVWMVTGYVTYLDRDLTGYFIELGIIAVMCAWVCYITTDDK